MISIKDQSYLDTEQLLLNKKCSIIFFKGEKKQQICHKSMNKNLLADRSQSNLKKTRAQYCFYPQINAIVNCLAIQGRNFNKKIVARTNFILKIGYNDMYFPQFAFAHKSYCPMTVLMTKTSIILAQYVLFFVLIYTRQLILCWKKINHLQLQIIYIDIIMSDSQQLSNNQQQQESNWQEKDVKDTKPQKKTKRLKKNKKEGKGSQFTSSTYRKQKCQFFNKGNCTKGELCTYSHQFEPDTARKICKYYLSGSCSKGISCQYSHNTKIYPCKFYHIENRCQQSNNCKFSHNAIPVDFYQEYMKDNKDHILKLHKENRLTNKELFQFIEADIPKKQLQPPPIMSINPNTNNPSSKPEGVWINTLKKDPRQRMAKVKPQQQATIIVSIQAQIEEIVVKKQQQKIIQMKEQSLDIKLLTCLKQYFYSYY